MAAAVLLVAWHGVLLSLPHTHRADPGVPAMANVCVVAHPGSHRFHVHPEGRQLPPHGCLACLVRSTVAAGTSPVFATGPAVARRAPVAAFLQLAAVDATFLPDLRAPPAAC